MTTRRSGTKGVPRSTRETAILDAACAEFEQKGYAGAVVGSIAARAGISKTLVLNYFDSKEGVYVACVRRAGHSLITAIGDALETTATAADPPHDLGLASGIHVMAAIFGHLADRPCDWRLLYDRTVPDGPAREAARQQRHLLRVQAAEGVATALTSRGLTDPRDLSAMTVVWESVVSALVDWWQKNPDQSAVDMIARTQRIFAAIHGLS